ncbi:hypothetical protein DL768_011595 [Monosporascus sp. mg162]|nr:hypothetical protein DL768_011595 [Monosporascus sp. mg162]
MLVKGFLLGSPYQALERACYVCSTSCYLATIEFDELNVKALERSTWESRRVWTEVIDGISEGNTQRVREAKNRIKGAQREMRDTKKVAKIQ